MNESRLDEDLKSLAKRPRSSLPADFKAMVWSKVQSRERISRPGRENWFKTLFSAVATPQWAVAGLALALVAGWSLGRITIGGSSQTETRLAATVTGEVIDMACYFADGARGADHAACARMCIASGLPVGLMTKEGSIYVLIGKQEPPSAQPAAKHETLNAQLAPYAAKIVTVNGTIVRKKGVNVIENAELITREALWQPESDRMTKLKAHLTHFL